METETPKCRLLVVDDHAGLRDGVRMILDGLPDIEVAGEAATGEAAIEACRATPYDVVLLDIRLPDRPGPEVARVLKAAGAETKIIIFSMREEETVKELVKNVGADAYVSKTADADVLIETIRSVVWPAGNR